MGRLCAGRGGVLLKILGTEPSLHVTQATGQGRGGSGWQRDLFVGGWNRFLKGILLAVGRRAVHCQSFLGSFGPYMGGRTKVPVHNSYIYYIISV